MLQQKPEHDNYLHRYRVAREDELCYFGSLMEDLYAPGCSTKISRLYAKDPEAFRVHTIRSLDHLSLAGPWRSNSPFGTMLLYFPPRRAERDMILMNEEILTERGYSFFVSPVLGTRDLAPFLDLGFSPHASLMFFKKTNLIGFFDVIKNISKPVEDDPCLALRPSQFDQVIEIDRENFQGFWSYGRKDLIDLLSYAKCHVLEEKGNVFGYVIYSHKGSYGNIIRIAVKKEFQSMGSGSILLNSAVQKMRRAGVREIGLCTQAENVIAQNFYIKNGFKRSGGISELLSKRLLPQGIHEI